MRLSVEAQSALKLLAGYQKPSLNAYGLSDLSGREWSETSHYLHVIQELASKGFLALKNPGGHRAWGPVCDHYQIDFAKVGDWVAEDAYEPPQLHDLATAGPRERLSALAL